MRSRFLERIRRSTSRVAASPVRTAGAVTHRRLLLCEALEDRRLLSIGIRPALPGDVVDARSIGQDANSARQESTTIDLGYARAAADRIIVRFTDELGSAAAMDAFSGLGGKVIRELPIINGAVVELGGGDVPQAVSQWSAHPSVLYAEPDYQYQFLDTFPNDPRFGELWGLHNTGQTGGTPDADVDAPEAWDLITDSSTVVIASIDSGVDYNHEDLAANMWTNAGEIPGNGMDDDGNGYVDDVYGIDPYNGDSDPWDDFGHGTHTAGTLGAQGDNGIGVAGVNWDVQIMALKVGDAFGLPDSAVIESLNYIVQMKNVYGVNVVASNNSWGGGPYSQALKDAIEASNNAGVMFVAAAGNGGWDGIGDDNDVFPEYPANYDLDGIIAVAATDHNDDLAVFSNYGATSVDLGAPGVSVLSTFPGNVYALADGTSMATPHVTGAVGMAMAFCPTATLAQVKTAILDGADAVTALAGRTVSGGRLNAYNMLWELPFMVVGSSPADGEIVTAPVTDFVIDFPSPYDPGTVDASDLTVNTIAADTVTQTDADTLTFRYVTSPVTAQGEQTMAIAAGCLERASDGSPVEAWQAAFRYDALRMQVTSTVPADGSLVTIPFTTLQVNLNEVYDTASVGTDDVILSQGTVTAAAPVDADTVEYTLDGINTEEPLTINMPAGAMTDGYGNPMLPYAGSFVLDYLTAPLATPLEAKEPRGSLIYDASVGGTIGVTGDEDSFTIDLDHPQTITVVVSPDLGLQPTVELLDSVGSIAGPVSAGGPGADAVLQTVATTGPSTYTVKVSGANNTTGFYTVQVILNAAVEMEAHGGSANDDLGTAQGIDDSSIPLGGGSGGRAAVLGSLETSIQTIYYENLDGDPVWTLDGEWAWGDPAGQGGVDLGYPDPSSGYTGTSVCGVNLSGDYTTTPGGPYYATTGVIDCSGHQGVSLEFWRWLNTDHPPWAFATVDVYDAATWNNIYTNPTSGEVADNSWQPMQYDVSSYADNNPDVRIRWGYEIGSGAMACSGWNIDDVSVMEVEPDTDFYSFDLLAGESATAALTALGGASVSLELLDFNGTTLAVGGNANNVDAVISSFVAPGSGTYYLKVSGEGEYSLVVTRNAGFDTERNDDLPPDAQDITLDGTGLGHVGPGAGEPTSPSIPASDGNFLRGTDPPSIGPAPVEKLSSSGSSGADPPMVAMLADYRAYGTEGLNMFLARFDLDAPEVLEEVSPQIGFFPAGDFDNSGDFSTAFAIDYDTSTLVSIDTASGAMTPIGPSTPYAGEGWTGMAMDPTTGTMYASSTNSVTSSLYTVDLATGAATRIGAITSAPGVIALAVDDAGEMFAQDIVNDNLIRVDKATGAGTIVGSLGFDANYSQGMDFDEAGGQLYLAAFNNASHFAELRIADRSTGATTLVGVLGGTSHPGWAELDWMAVAAGGGPREDFYSIEANAGDPLVVNTSIPMAGPGEFVNLLDVAVELFDPAGAPVAFSSTGSLSHTAAMTGTYAVRVLAENDTQGEYVLEVSGHTGALPALKVATTDPADGQRLPASPATFTVHFDDLVLLTTLDAADLVIDGGAFTATGVTVVDGDTVTFGLPGLAEGPHTVTIAGGAIQDLQGTPIQPFSGAFYIDLTGPRVTSSSLLEGELVLIPPGGTLVYTAQFDEALNAMVLDSSDVALVGLFSGPHTADAFDYDPVSSILTLQYGGLPEDEFTLRLTSGDGAFEDLVGTDLDGEPDPATTVPSGDGTPGGDFVVNFSFDVAQTKANEFERFQPLGSLMSGSGGSAGLINYAGDQDDWTFFAEAGQKIAAVVYPDDPAAVLSIELPGLAGPFSAPGPGEPALIPPQTVPADGDYEIVISGDALTLYELEIGKNLTAELGDTDDGSELAIDDSLVELGSGRYGVIGTSQQPLATLDSVVWGVQPATGLILLIDPATGAVVTVVSPLGGPLFGLGALGGNPLNLALPERDEYEIDLTGKAGQPIDVVLAGGGGVDFSGEQLQLLDVDGVTVLAEAVPDPLGVAAENYDLAILDFVVPADGVYTLRFVSTVDGDYGIVVTDPLVFDSEPNDATGDPQQPLRSLDGTRAAIGYLFAGNGGPTVPAPATGDGKPASATRALAGVLSPADAWAAVDRRADVATDSKASGATGASASLTPGSEVYVVDDGTHENGIGLTDGGDIMWLNRFTAEPGFEVISSIALAWGPATPGVVSKVLLYEDPNDDGDPSDAVLLTTADTVVAEPGTDLFTTVPITPTMVSGTFFVAGLLQYQTPGEHPASLDESSSAGGSWVVGNTVPGALDIDALMNNDIPPALIDSFGFPGNWLLRADADPVDTADLYEITLAAGETIIIYARTPFDAPPGTPFSDLDPALIVYDPSGTPVASDGNSLDGRNARIAFTASTSGVHTIGVSAESGTGEYLLLVEPAQTASYYGTEEDDEIVFATDGINHTITINSVPHATTAFSVEIDALGGNDTIRMYLSGAAEKAYLDVGTVYVDGLPSYQVQADSVETVRVYGGGSDEAYFTGSPGDDRFESYETHSYLQTTGIYNLVVGFAKVEANLSFTGGGGTNDRAYLYDSAAAADDTFYGDEVDGSMDRGTNGTIEAKAIGFDIIKGLAAGGGANDEAYLYGSAGDERLYSYETYSYVNYANLQNYVGGFDYVEIDVTPGGPASTDRAWMFDSAAAVDDTFYGEPGESRMVFNTGKQNKAIGFDIVRAYATGGGSNDEAYLTGSAGQDRFISYETCGWMYGPGYWNLARGFDYVKADATTGSEVSYDRAWLYDSDAYGDDTFHGDVGNSRMDRGSDTVIDAWAVAFDNVRASAYGGGANDRAYLTGSSLDDRFYGYETHSYIQGPGYYTLSVGFDHTEADVSGSGGSDRADLYDTVPSNDHFIGHSSPATNYGELTYGGGTYIKAEGFGVGLAWATGVLNADQDWAELYLGTVWGAYGSGWELIINHAVPGAPGATDLDLSLAGWVATLKDAETTSNGDGESEEVDLASLDYLFKQFGAG